MAVTVTMLENLGFNEKKAKLYLALLEGGGTASELATRAKLKRSTVYGYLDELIASSLVTQSIRGVRRYFVAEDPERLSQLFQQRLNLVDSLMPSLKSMFASGNGASIPYVRYYEGIDGVHSIHEELLRSTGEYYYFGTYQGMAKVLGQKYISDFTGRRVRKGVWSYGIRFKNQETNLPDSLGTKENKRTVHYLPNDLVHSTASITIFKGKTLIMALDKTVFGFIIEEENLYILLKSIWDFIWERTRP